MELHYYLAVTCLLIGGANALYENCDYYQDLQLGTAYYVYSEGYPNKYPPGSSCRWYAVSPPGTQIFLMCQNLDIPPSQNCYYDRLSISRTGNLDFTDGTNYCGNGSFSVYSVENRMNVRLLTAPNSPGGSFLCNIGVQKPTTPQPPSGNRCNCGWKSQTKIVGGRETGINEYPMMAGLIDSVARELFCGATIISHRYALSAAHCMIKKKAYEIGLLVGDHDISVGNDTDSAKLYLIIQIRVHSGYNTVSHENDIALVRTDQDISYSRQVGPACLPFADTKNSFAGETVWALGWGTTDFGGKTSNKLLKVDLDVLTLGQCKGTYGNSVSDKQMCTYRQDKDACQSDSGGPLLWQDRESGSVKILGIISYGIQCATRYPSVNTRVSSYLDWIGQNTGEEFCVR